MNKLNFGYLTMICVFALFLLSGCFNTVSVPTPEACIGTLPNDNSSQQDVSTTSSSSMSLYVQSGATKPGSSPSNNQTSNPVTTPNPPNSLNSFNNNSNNSLQISNSLIGIEYSNNQFSNTYTVNSQNTTNINNSGEGENQGGSLILGSEYNNGSNNSIAISNSIIQFDISNNQFNNTYNVNSQNTTNLFNTGDNSGESDSLNNLSFFSGFNSNSNNTINISNSLINIYFTGNQINNTYNVNETTTNNVTNTINEGSEEGGGDEEIGGGESGGEIP